MRAHAGCTWYPCDLDLWPFNFKIDACRATDTKYICTKFSVDSLRRFPFRARTDRHRQPCDVDLRLFELWVTQCMPFDCYAGVDSWSRFPLTAQTNKKASDVFNGFHNRVTFNIQCMPSDCYIEYTILYMTVDRHGSIRMPKFGVDSSSRCPVT